VIEFVDKSKRSVELTLWAELAEEFEGQVGDVVIIKNARVNDFQSYKSLNFASSLSSMELNPDIDIAKELKKWFAVNAETLASETKSISSGARGPSGPSLPATFGNYAELKEAIISTNDNKKGIVMRIPSTVSWFKRDDQAPLFYKAVPNDRYKVVENTLDPSNGKAWYSPATKKYYDSYTPRFILTVSGTDFSGSQILNCFDDYGKSLLGCEASDVEHLKIHDTAKLELVFEQALFQRKILKVRAQEEGQGDELKIQYVICGVENFDFAKESKTLLEKIHQLKSKKID